MADRKHAACVWTEDDRDCGDDCRSSGVCPFQAEGMAADDGADRAAASFERIWGQPPEGGR